MSAIPPATPQSPPQASTGGAKRKRNQKRKNKGSNDPHSPGSVSSASTASSHQHSHDHSGGGHSHDGIACHGHGGGGHSHDGHNEIYSTFGDVDPENVAEAMHYCDVCWHYQSYRSHAFARLERMQADFEIIPTVLQELVPGFEARMTALRKGVATNSLFIAEILKHRYVFHNTPELDYDMLEAKVAREHPIDEERMGRVRSTIRQCVRDWSTAGAAERASCYGPILNELERLFPTMADRKDIKVLVPGSGLGRLVWECASRGFHATGNEFSYFMLMCSFLILNCCKATDIFTIYPYIHEAKNLLDPEDQLRTVTIPDVDPTKLPEQGHLSMAAGDWMDIFSDLPGDYIHGGYKRKCEKDDRRMREFEEHQRKRQAAKKRQEEEAKKQSASSSTSSTTAVPTVEPIEDEPKEVIPDPIRAGDSHGSNAATWDVFASCYFIDCATNILEFLRTIAYVLKPGGYWINFGPLLYHFSDVPNEISVDLSWAELRRAIPYFGLELVREELNQPSAYTTDERSMLRQEYFCVSCTWKKVGEDLTTKPLAIRPSLPEPKSIAWNSRLESNQEWTTIGIQVGLNPTNNDYDHILTVDALARKLRSTPVQTGSGESVQIWSLPAAKVGAFLLKVTNQADLLIGKLIVEGVETIGIMKKK